METDELERAGTGEAAARRRLRRDLAGAVRRGQFELHYQPRRELGSGRRTALEALLRWPCGRRGMVSAQAIGPVAAEAGLGAAVGGWMLAAACAEAAGWAVDPVLTVRVPAELLRPGALGPPLTAALDASGLPAERLELCLPEEALAEPDADMLLTLAGLRDLGVGLVLDGFGSALGSLAALRRLPLSGMRLAAVLTRALPFDREDMAVARAAVAAAHALGLAAIAAGIETEAQRACLAAIGCDEGQGKLIGPALPGEALRGGRPH